ncbi:MAG: tripartite tricarboxylate transporter substrate binding protein, partial [Planctomycetota bacterium]|nr:tripartite tricarboxylate transporter substrate binding protein [Planctomycetota bacterium]
MIRKILFAAFLAIAVTAAAVRAVEYPSRNVSVIVPANPGGPTDLSTRGVIDCLPQGAVPPGVAFVVTNIGGGSGLIAANKFVSSRKDGYTLGAVNCDFLLNSVSGKTPLTMNEFIPISFISADPYAFVIRSDAPFKTFTEFVDYVRANPDAVTIGDTGPGAVPAFATKAMVKSLGLKVKYTSYGGSRDCVVALGSNEIQATFTHPSAALGQLQSGDLKAIAFSSNERYKLMPDVPAIGELYPKECGDMQIIGWITLAALKGTDPGIVDWLQKNFIEASKSDKFKER